MGHKKNRGYSANYVFTVDGQQLPPMTRSKKKITSKNAFYFYMQDFQYIQETKGIFYKSQKEVADAAASSWRYLSAEERKLYQEAEKEAKAKAKGDLSCKFTNEGKSYADVNKEEAERRERQEKMLGEIRSTIRSLRSPPALNNYPFHLIHVNYYCKTTSGLYVPCELAISEFSLSYGVKRHLHVLINPGELPLGYTFEAEKHSELTHRIPMPNEFQFEGVLTDYVRIFQNVRSFLRDAKAEYKLPPLYTTTSQLEACENVLAMLCDSVNEDNIFRVYPAKEMFFELQRACIDIYKPTDESIVKLPFVSLAERELEKDIFDFSQDISCNFHDNTDVIPFCSLSCVRKWCFLILENCARVTGMPLIPGHHVPEYTNVSQFNKLRAPMQQKKSEMHKLNDTIQNLHVSSSKNTSHSTMLSEALDMGKQAGGLSAASAEALRAPKQISEAMHLLSPDESDDELPLLGS